ncbi:manganese efflux pump MntP family protein [bacterium]|nr:manganese efflux pump MntP family protein [bacterium]
MHIFSIIGIAVALAMDAFAVSIAVGIQLKTTRFRQFFRLSFHFGLFQALMPIIGWSAGLTIRSLIAAFDHWIAFGLLALVGGNMLKEAFTAENPDREEKKDATKGMTMVMLSVATSIDALAVGFSLSIINEPIILPAVVIGLVALIFTIIGLNLGNFASNSSWVKPYAEILGGLVLFGIGLNILYEHHALAFMLD